MMQGNNIDIHNSDMKDCASSIMTQGNTRTKSRKKKYNTKAEKLEANRKSAADSRYRKKAAMMRLQQEVIKLRREKMLLQLENAKLKQMNIANPQDSVQSFDPLLLSPSAITNLRSQLGMVAGPVAGSICNLHNNFKQPDSIIKPIITSTTNQLKEEQIAKIRQKVRRVSKLSMHVLS